MSSTVGIVVSGHGELAPALVSSAEMIVGSQDNIDTVCLTPEDNPEACRLTIMDAIDRVTADDGETLVLVDLYGGTPCNSGMMGLQERSYAIVAGVNLPMLLEVLMNRSSVESASELAAIALEAGKAGVLDVVSEFESRVGQKIEGIEDSTERRSPTCTRWGMQAKNAPLGCQHP